MMEGKYSTRSPAVKRLMREAQELCEPTDQYFAQPLEDNLFEWHFTVRGPLDSDFQAGIYHGRIILPVDYPMKPPSIIWLTPNGRFETNKKICLSISGHHPESWQPSWSIRTALLAIIGFMPTHPGGAIGSLDYKPEERKALARKSRDWKCPTCGNICDILLEPSPESVQTSQEAKELASQISFQGEKPKSSESPVKAVITSPSSEVTTTVNDAEPSHSNVCTSAPPNISCSAATNAPVNTTPPSIVPHPWTLPPFVPPGGLMPPPFPPFPWMANAMTHNNQNGGVLSWIPRFPYPPSHYTCLGSMSFYPAGYAPPPGVGMFLCPFPPNHRTKVEQPCMRAKDPSVIQVNDAQVPPNKNPDRVTQPQKSSSVIVLSDSPTAVQLLHKDPELAGEQLTPTIPNIPPPSPASAANSSEPASAQVSPLKVHVLSELLSQVKCAESDEQIHAGENRKENLHASVTIIDGASQVKKTGSETSPQPECEPGYSTAGRTGNKQTETLGSVCDRKDLKCPETISGAFMDRTLGGPEVTDDSSIKLQEDGGHEQSQASETEISCRKKESQNELTGMETSCSADMEEDSGAGDEEGQRSNFEKSISSSVPDLKNRQKPGGVKGLRQRQSATARVPTDVPGDEQSSSDQGGATGGGQRIEAVSGDSSPQRQWLRRDGRQNHGNEARHAQRRGPVQARDTSFIVMVVLCVATGLIIFNRLYYMFLSDLFS